MYYKNMLYHITSIILTTLFLVSSTYYWFFVREVTYYEEIENNNILVSNEIEFTSLSKVSDKDINSLNGYELKIQNKGIESEDIKIYIVPNILFNNVTNNYVKYQVNNGNIKSLNTDGMIYVSNLDYLETEDINLKIWLSETYMGELNYNGRVIVG